MDPFLLAAQSKAEQELTEKELKKAEWDMVRSSARWFHIERRMSRDFFLSINQQKSNLPIHQLLDEIDKEYNTNRKLSKYTSRYCEDLFTTQGASIDCSKARDEC